MDKIAIYMSAYNAEKTLSASIEGILKQTYSNYVLYIVDNGSTDHTFEIIKSYCSKFDFIFCYRREQNFAGSFMELLYTLMDKADYSFSRYVSYDSNGAMIPSVQRRPDWVCFIDSDDITEPMYLEELLFFAKKHALDMTMCGWDFVRPDRVEHRIPERNEIITYKEFASRLPDYDKFMGPVWNKLFRYDSLGRNISFYENRFSRLFKDGVYFYGADTAFNYLYLENGLDRFGIVAKSLYQYKIYDESVSRKQFHPMRIISDRRMAEVRLDFLQRTGEEITEENRTFIMNIYFKSIKATIDLLLQDEQYDLKQKMKYLHEIFAYKLMGEAFMESEERYL